MKGSREVQELKSLLLEVRNEIGDTDEKYPHIKKNINSNWD